VSILQQFSNTQISYFTIFQPHFKISSTSDLPNVLNPKAKGLASRTQTCTASREDIEKFVKENEIILLILSLFQFTVKLYLSRKQENPKLSVHVFCALVQQTRLLIVLLN
jgi:hypothetical protein